jgi:glutathione S-transferase
VRRKLTQILKLDDAAAATGLQAVSATWDEVDAMLADGRAYLCGGRLTLADLAFATSGAPMVLHPGYGGHLPDVKACPQTIRETVFALRARPAGQFIARLYADHRAP